MKAIEKLHAWVKANGAWNKGKRSPYYGMIRKKVVRYTTIHRRVYRDRGKAKICEHCHRLDQKRYEWANVSGNYYDVNDYIQLCTKCHRKMDSEKPNSYGKRDNRLIKKRNCIKCKKLFLPKTGNQVRCGSKVRRTGCAYGRFSEYQRNYYKNVRSKRG